VQCGNSGWSGPEVKQEMKLMVWKILSLRALTEVKISQIHCISSAQPRGGEDMNEKSQIVVFQNEALWICGCCCRRAQHQQGSPSTIILNY